MSKSIKQRVLNIIIKGIRALNGVDKKTVLFSSFSGSSYSDNPRAVSEKIHEIAHDYKVVWAFNPDAIKDSCIIPEYVHRVNINNFWQYYSAVATCKAWVSNFAFPNIPKGKDQIFIQTWHGDRAFKKVLYDTPSKKGERFLAESQDGFCNYAIAGSDYGERQFRSAFHYKGIVIKEGTPRDDVLVHLDLKRTSNVKKLLHLNDDCNYLLYAPTLRRTNHRDHSAQEIQDIDIHATLKTLEKKYNKTWKCLMRGHPSVGGLKGIEYGEDIIDVSKYDDMTDLLLIADMLITDYSSCAGDFALLKRPLILYQSDRAEYESVERAFYFDIDKSPYFIARSQEEVERLISDFSDEKIKKNCRDILLFYGTNETGEASKKVVELICE